ncbi:hypothetical protein D9M71_672580 [compost metagenome]
MRHGLRCIDDQQRTDLTHAPYDGHQVRSQPGDIRDLGNRDDPCFGGDHVIEYRHVQNTFGSHRPHVQGGPGSTRRLLPRDEVAVMLQLGHNYLVPLAESLGKRMGQQV